MVTDGILRAVDMMIENSFEPEQNIGIGLVKEMLCNFDENLWHEMSEEEKDAWVKKFLPKVPGVEKETGKIVNATHFTIKDNLGEKRTINREKVRAYVETDMIMEFDSPEACMEYFNIYDYQKFQTVEEMKAYQGKYGFGLDGKWYHINIDEALDVWEVNNLESIKEYFESVCLGDYDLDGCEISEDDYRNVLGKLEKSNKGLEEIVHEYLIEIRDVLDMGLEENTEKENLNEKIQAASAKQRDITKNGVKKDIKQERE